MRNKNILQNIVQKQKLEEKKQMEFLNYSFGKSYDDHKYQSSNISSSSRSVNLNSGRMSISNGSGKLPRIMNIGIINNNP